MKDKYSLYITAETKAKILSEYPNIGLSAAVTHKFMGESQGESPNTQTDIQNTEMDIQNMKMDIQNAIDRLETLEMWKMDVE